MAQAFLTDRTGRLVAVVSGRRRCLHPARSGCACSSSTRCPPAPGSAMRLPGPRPPVCRVQHDPPGCCRPVAAEVRTPGRPAVRPADVQWSQQALDSSVRQHAHQQAHQQTGGGTQHASRPSKPGGGPSDPRRGAARPRASVVRLTPGGEVAAGHPVLRPHRPQLPCRHPWTVAEQPAERARVPGSWPWSAATLTCRLRDDGRGRPPVPGPCRRHPGPRRPPRPGESRHRGALTELGPLVEVGPPTAGDRAAERPEHVGAHGPLARRPQRGVSEAAQRGASRHRSAPRRPPCPGARLRRLGPGLTRPAPRPVGRASSLRLGPEATSGSPQRVPQRVGDRLRPGPGEDWARASPRRWPPARRRRPWCRPLAAARCGRWLASAGERLGLLADAERGPHLWARSLLEAAAGAWSAVPSRPDPGAGQVRAVGLSWLPTSSEAASFDMMHIPCDQLTSPAAGPRERLPQAQFSRTVAGPSFVSPEDRARSWSLKPHDRGRLRSRGHATYPSPMPHISAEQRADLGPWRERWDELVLRQPVPSPFQRTWWLDAVAAGQATTSSSRRTTGSSAASRWASGRAAGRPC